MKRLTGHAAFLTGAAAICVPPAVRVLCAILTGQPWFGRLTK